jgi:hypothetical protein
MRRLNEREEVAVPLGVLFVPIILMRTNNYQVAAFGVVLFIAIYILYSKYFFPDIRSKVVTLLGAVTVGVYGLASCRNGRCKDYSHDLFDGLTWSDSVYIAYLVTVSLLIFKNYKKKYR